MLRNDRNKPLQAAQDGSMNNHRAGHDRLVRRPVSQVEALRELEVELDGRALEGAAEGVADRDVNFGAVERAVAWVELPFAWVVFVEGLGELLGEEEKEEEKEEEEEEKTGFG